MINEMYFHTISQVRDFINQHLVPGDTLVYKLPYPIKVTTDDVYGELECVLVMKNSIKSRPRLFTELGLMVELSHCHTEGLFKAMRELTVYLHNEQKSKELDGIKRVLDPYFGKDLRSIVNELGMSASMVDDFVQEAVINGNMSNLEALKQAVSLINIINEFKEEYPKCVKVGAEDYHKMNLKDKILYHQVMAMSASDDAIFHTCMRDTTTTRYSTELSILTRYWVSHPKWNLISSGFDRLGIKKFLFDGSLDVECVENLVTSGFYFTGTTTIKSEFGFTNSCIVIEKIKS